jgi:hypothetical protein
LITVPRYEIWHILAASQVAVSRTCIHADADAVLHPECPGCAALIARMVSEAEQATMGPSLRAERIAELQDLTNATLPADAWLAADRPSLLPIRDLTPDERAAHDEDPRPGVWTAELGADLRALTQEQTDVLIRSELVHVAAAAEREEVLAAVGGLDGLSSVRVAVAPDLVRDITRQRGGIDSDPLVRLLAYRAWGDRDRRWFELRGSESELVYP